MFLQSIIYPWFFDDSHTERKYLQQPADHHWHSKKRNIKVNLQDDLKRNLLDPGS